MPKADSSARIAGQWQTDCLVIGGGIMGLWTAFKAGKAGLDVVLVDAGTIGQGASGGLLGALFPWLPERWMDKKQFQFDALTSLGNEIAALEAETGLAVGHARTGRLIPLPEPHLRVIHDALSHQAESLWRTPETGFRWQVLDKSPCPDWLADAAGANGFALDSLAGRVDPRRLTSVLAAALARAPKVRLIEQATIGRLDPVAGTLSVNGQTIAFSHAVVAAGVGSFPLIESLLPAMPRRIGQGVKGQAAMLSAQVDPAWPVIFRDGLYIVAHAGNRVAIGSTSENDFSDPLATDGQVDELIARARTIVPVLAQAPVIERWAGLRPKAILRDPMVGPLPGAPNVLAMTGGFKISFGIAHRLADHLVALMTGGQGPALPDTFATAGHVAAASRA